MNKPIWSKNKKVNPQRKIKKNGLYIDKSIEIITAIGKRDGTSQR